MTCLDCPQRLVIDIVVHGRFHAFALARALIAHGHDVLVHTNYPATIVERFGVPVQNVHSCLSHGVGSRLLGRMQRFLPKDAVESALLRWFGQWAAKSVRPEADLVYGFSGVMEEYLLTQRTKPGQLRVMVRGSSHIRVQHRLLMEEETRGGEPVEKPGAWMIAREEREYELADLIFVLSSFARDSFIEVRPELTTKLMVNPLGVDVDRFAATEDVHARRQRRILAGDPLTILTVGTFSYRKGMLDLIESAQQMAGRAKFRFVGDFPLEAAKLKHKAEGLIELRERVPEAQLPEIYAAADVFLFPTIEDGFAAVLLQAVKAGLPVVATANCSAPDIIVEGKTGWVVPIRDPDAIVKRLTWCDANRQKLAAVAHAAAADTSSNTWNTMAIELIGAYSIAKPQSVMA